MKKIKIVTESELADRFAKRVLKEMNDNEWGQVSQHFQPIDNEVSNRYKGPDIPHGYVDDEILVQKLETAKQLGEWHLVDEVIMDLKYR
jgi:hypothetical protein